VEAVAKALLPHEVANVAIDGADPPEPEHRGSQPGDVPRRRIFVGFALLGAGVSLTAGAIVDASVAGGNDASVVRLLGLGGALLVLGAVLTIAGRMFYLATASAVIGGVISAIGMATGFFVQVFP
jgi:hypothetical protein